MTKQELFQSKNHVLEVPLSQTKMRLKNALQKGNFLMAKSIHKSYKLNCRHKCSCMFPYSYTLSCCLVFKKKPFYVKLPTFSTAQGTQNQIKPIADTKSKLKINMRSRWTVFQILLLSAVIFIQKILHVNEMKQYLKS